MLGILVKKQLKEVFRSYFYNQKKNQARSKASIILWFVFFGFILIGVLGGTFTGVSFALCVGLQPAGMGWLYFDIMSGIAIAFGAFGSVFNTYSSLYLPKDNDLLLSMPIPVNKIIISRLINVYLLGIMYSATVIVPALIVYRIFAGVSVITVVCGLLLLLIISVIVLILSCLLGLVVAKISVKLKNKSFITVFISLAFIGGYYFVYFKAQSVISDLIDNAAVYGTNVKNSAYFLYMFGMIGEGNIIYTLIFAAVTVLLLALTLFVLSRNFLKLASGASAGSKTKARYKEKQAKERSVFGALLGKEFARFTTSPNYMLNCGLGVLLLPALGIFMLIKGSEIMNILGSVFGYNSGFAEIILCAALLLLSTMNDMSAPSVSLEGRSIWIPQSLPVEAKTVLMAKTAIQLILSGGAMLFAVVCSVIVLDSSIPVKIMICVVCMLFVVFSSLFGTFLGVKNPILEWANEVIPIKQSGAIMIAIFGGWGFVAVIAVPAFLITFFLPLWIYLIVWAVLLATASVLLYFWMIHKGAEAFSYL